MDKLDGKVAIVTGAARGLGRAYAKRLAGMGAKFAVVDLNLRSYERPVMVWNRSRTASRWSNPFLRRKSARLLETSSLRRKAANFYCFRKACLK